jgi:predicted RNA-binding protein Jag
MKSMLQEGTSLAKAIEKAWESSGKPSEFIIKILETPQKNFLGFVKRPAVVSLTYDLKKPGVQTINNTKNYYKDQRNPVRTGPQQPVKQFDKFQQNRKDQKPDLRPDFRQDKNKQQTNLDQLRPLAEKPQIQDEQWTQEHISSASNYLKELTLLLTDNSVNFSTKADRKLLTFSLEKPLLDSPDEERPLLISFSFLIIQFLKKQYKKKFRGYQLIITSKVSNRHEKQHQNPNK